MVVRGRIDYWVRMDIRVHSKSLSNWVVDSMGMEKLGGEQRRGEYITLFPNKYLGKVSYFSEIREKFLDF